MKTSAEWARRVFNLLLGAAVVWVATSVLIVIFGEEEASGVGFYNPSGWKVALIDVEFLSFRIAEAALAVLAGSWLFNRLAEKG